MNAPSEMTVASDKEPRELPLSLLLSEELLTSRVAMAVSRVDLLEERVRPKEASWEGVT